MADDPDDAFWASLGAKPAAAKPEAPTAAPDDAFWNSLGAQGTNANPAGPPGLPGQIDPLTGQPFAFAGAPGKNDKVAQSTGQKIAEGRVPGFVAQAATSLPTDPDAQRRVMAAQLFPNMPPNEAKSRIFYDPDGRMAAVDDNGQPFYVQPDKRNLSPSNLLALAGSGTGMAITGAGGLLGGIAGTPGSPVGSVVLAGAGAALGDQLRQYGARMVDPQPELTRPNPLQTAIEAGLAAGGQGVGSVINHAISPNALSVSVPDLRAIRLPGAMNNARAAYGNALTQGVDLTPGQATGLGSLLAYEDAARSMPGTRDVADAFYRRQGNQLTGAAGNFLDTVSPNANKTEAAQLFQQGADDAITGARQQANAAARPSYDAAQGRGQIMSPDLAQLAEQPAVQQAMDRARVTYQNLYRTPAPDTPDFRLWDLTKRSLDDMHGAAVRNADGLTGRTTASGIDSLRQDLLTHLDTAFPEYATARETSGAGQRLAARLEDSGTGTTAEGTGAERAKAITGPIFGQNPQAIAESRDAFAAAGRTDEWNAGVRAHLQDAFERASMSQQGLNPAMLRRQVWGNADNRDAMQAAMTPAQFTGFDRFMGTVEAAARTFPQNSLTAPRTEAIGALKGAAASSGDVQAVQTIANLFSLPKLVDLPARLGDKYAQMRMGQNMRGIVGRLFSPDGLQYLQAMSNYSPGSQKAIAATSQFVTRYGPQIGELAGGGKGQLPAPPANSLSAPDMPPQ